MSTSPLKLVVSKARAVVARNKLRAPAVSARKAEGDMAGGDLASGGLKKPAQAKPKFRQRKQVFSPLPTHVVKELFRKLPIEVEAVLLAGPTSVETLEGKMSGEKGDWLVTGVAGEQYIVQRAIFADTFEPADSAAKELWSLTYPVEAPAQKADDDPELGTPPAAATPAPPPPPPVAGPPHKEFRGIPVVVDRPRGHVMTGTDSAGQPWRRVYHVDYGYVPGTKGGDGEGLDVFIGGDESAAEAHWILQRKADGSFDEYKCILGCPDPKSARAIYEMHVPKRFFGSMCSMPVEFMKALLGIEPVELTKVLEGVRAIVKSSIHEALFSVTLTKAEFDARIAKPFGGFADFGACVASMREQGHDEEGAHRICGSLQADTEKHERTVKLAKADPMVPAVPAQSGAAELRYVLGIVLEPEVVDAQGDVYSADEIRRSAWEYMEHFRNVGLMHKGLVNGKVRLVESYVAPADMRLEGSVIRKGTWMLGLHVADDELWDQVKSGALTGLSIGGFARRTPAS